MPNRFVINAEMVGECDHEGCEDHFDVAMFWATKRELEADIRKAGWSLGKQTLCPIHRRGKSTMAR